MIFSFLHISTVLYGLFLSNCNSKIIFLFRHHKLTMSRDLWKCASLCLSVPKFLDLNYRMKATTFYVILFSCWKMIHCHSCELSNITIAVEKEECGFCILVNATWCSGYCFTRVRIQEGQGRGRGG